jgi:hypothetical protein
MTTSSHARHRVRPTLETLEDRTNPSSLPGVSLYSVPLFFYEDAAEHRITVSLTSPATEPASITVQTTGTATRDVDFYVENPLITFAPGEQFKELVLRPVDDRIDEPNETVQISFSNYVGIVDGGSTCRFQLYNVNEQGSSVVTVFHPYNDGAVEGKTSQFIFALSHASQRPIEVQFVYTSSPLPPIVYPMATLGQDYRWPQSITIDPYTTTKTIQVTITDDTVREPIELIHYRLSSSTGNTFFAGQGGVLVEDNDVPTISFQRQVYRVAEEYQIIPIKMSLSAPLLMDANVTVQARSKYIQGLPTALEYTLNIQAGQTSVVFPFHVEDDAIFTGNQNIVFTLKNANFIKARPGTFAVVQIKEDDPLPSVSLYDNAAFPLNQGTAILPVLLTQIACQPVYIRFDIYQGDQLASAHKIVTQVVQIRPGTSTTDIVFPFASYTQGNASRTFHIVMRNVLGANFGPPGLETRLYRFTVTE